MTTPNSAPSSIASAAPPSRRKPRISLAIATALGLGYIPKAPGTFGSLAGVALACYSPYLVLMAAAWVPATIFHVLTFYNGNYWMLFIVPTFWAELALFLIVALVGVWTASRVAAYLGSKDPQIVVVDEVSGQFLTLWIGSLWPTRLEALHILGKPHTFGDFLWFPLNWKCVLAGFILFRVFDIWKPFPARQAESLPRGWGIMADDWVAGLYGALGLWILRALGL
jgi:phosphatidylglycerophosphatase A